MKSFVKILNPLAITLSILSSSLIFQLNLKAHEKSVKNQNSGQVLLSSNNVLTSTSFDVKGFDIVENKGMVMGVIVRRPTIGQNFKSSFQGYLAGNVNAYVQMCEQGRVESFTKMINEAKSIGANGIVCVRYDSNSFNESSDQFASEIICYGTAVVLKPSN